MHMLTCICWKPKLLLFKKKRKKKIARCFQTDPNTQPSIMAPLKVWNKQIRGNARFNDGGRPAASARVHLLGRRENDRHRNLGRRRSMASPLCWRRLARRRSCAHCWSIHAWLPFSIRRAKCPRNPRSLASLILNFLRSDDTD